jgi:hypothetical protein
MIFLNKDRGKNCFENNHTIVSKAKKTACDSKAFELIRPFDLNRTCSSITTNN